MNARVHAGPLLGLCLVFLLIGAAFGADSQSALFSRGYTVVPSPQRATLGDGDFSLDSSWSLVIGGNVSTSETAVKSLQENLLSRFQLSLSDHKAEGRTLSLEIEPGSVSIGEAQDREKDAIAEQAYRIELSPQRVAITANASPGLFYGVQTLVQLLKPSGGKLLLPEGEITDWPDLQLRLIFWDDAYHLERMDAFKRAIRQAAFYKINAMAVKLEGHFQFESVPALVEPYALTPAELQELADYGLRHHLQFIPWLDGPAHVAFILKHPEYARLRAFPDSNYEFCVTNPETAELLVGMFRELMAATKGVEYIYFSTDEPYYVGLADNEQCNEVKRARELGGPGALEAEFITKVAEPLHGLGRTVVFMGEYPLRPEDIQALPPYLINTIVNGPRFDPLYKARGIRQMLHTSTQGMEDLFPNYFILPDAKRLHEPSRREKPRVQGAWQHFTTHTAREQADLIGIINAGWGDAGLHPETFWLGYAAINAAGWRPSPGPEETMHSFYRSFYGHNAKDIEKLYRMMSYQAQFWFDSWEVVDSTTTKPIFGSSRQIFDPKRPRQDQTLPLPAVPSVDLAYNPSWRRENERRRQLAKEFRASHRELTELLAANLAQADWNRYNLEVFSSIAGIYGSNLEFLHGMSRVDELLAEADECARKGDHKGALTAVDEALDVVHELQRCRNEALAGVVQVWYKSWNPRVLEANGRRFLHSLDDVKDSNPARTVDMSYLIYRDLQLPLDAWYGQVQNSRNAYAARHGLSERSAPLNWRSLDE